MAQTNTEQDKIIKTRVKIQIYPKRVGNHTSAREGRRAFTFNQGNICKVILKNEMGGMDWKSFLGKKKKKKSLSLYI